MCQTFQMSMSVWKKLMNVKNTVIIQSVVTTVTVLDLTIDFTVMAPLVKVSHSNKISSQLVTVSVHTYLHRYQ